MRLSLSCVSSRELPVVIGNEKIITVVQQPGPQSVNRDALGLIASRAPPPGSAEAWPYHDNAPCRLQVDFVRLTYDYDRLATEMACAGLPDEFIETTQTGGGPHAMKSFPLKSAAAGFTRMISPPSLLVELGLGGGP
jgi:hypothetical protein